MDSHFTNGYTGRSLNNVLKFFEGCLGTIIPRWRECLAQTGFWGTIIPEKEIREKSHGETLNCYLKHSSASVSVVYDVMYVVGEKFGWEGHRPKRAQTLICTSFPAVHCGE